MASSANLGLPYLQPAQAQKHVTVNESLTRLDAMAQLVLQSTTVTTPPVEAVEGAVYAVPLGAVAPWDMQEGHLAVRANGGWDYVSPKEGWRAWVLDAAEARVFDGSVWTGEAAPLAEEALGSRFQALEFDHVIVPGGAHDTAVSIPAQSVVIGITGRVISDITGTASSWRLGVAGSDNRYGSSLGLALNSYLRGMTGSPLAYYADTPLRVTPEGGDFAGGEVRFLVHTIALDLPDPV